MVRAVARARHLHAGAFQLPKIVWFQADIAQMRHLNLSLDTASLSPGDFSQNNYLAEGGGANTF